MSSRREAMLPSHKRKRKSQKKAQVPSMPLLPPDVADDDIHISDDDIAYVAAHRKYAGFLSNLNTASLTKQVLGLKPSNKQDINLEEYYEKSKRENSFKEEHVQNNMVDPADALPVKTLSGELHYRTTKLKSLPENDDENNVSMSIDERKVHVRKDRNETSKERQTDLGDADSANKHSKADRRKERKLARKDKKTADSVAESLIHIAQEKSRVSSLEELRNDISEEERVEEMKSRIAELGTTVLSDPEGNMDSLIELQGFSTDKNSNIARMALLSLLVVFKDIIPGYRIRLPTPKELEMQVSKEIKKLRDFEAKLLKYYQKYVQVLIKSLKSDVHKKTAARCVSGLIEAIPHFNFRDSLMSSLIPLMDSTDSECRKMSCDAIRSLFQNEGKHGGLATVEAVEMIADFVKTGECLLHPDVVEVFLALSFDEDLRKPDSENKKVSSETVDPKNQQKDKKMKKRELEAKLREEVVADFRESSALSDPVERRKLQTQRLTAVFETYFRILKMSLHPTHSAQDITLPALRSTVADYGPRPLLRPCLDGLAKFSYLVSVDFMADLLAILKRLAAGNLEPISGQTAMPLTFIDRLHCCVVAFKIVRSNLDALNIDLRDFYVTLYNILLCHDLVSEEHGGLVLAEALQVMLWDNRQHDMQRVAAFIKRLSTKSLHVGPDEVMAGLVTVRHLLQRYRKCCSLLETDEGGGSVGGNIAVFHGEGNDPDLSGALSTVLWEVSLLSKHYHPDVAKLATQISKMDSDSKDFVLSALSPKDAVLQYSTKDGGFRPTIQLPRKLTSKKAYPNNIPLSKSMCAAGTIESGKNAEDTVSPDIFSSHFKVLRDFEKNKILRKELQQATRLIELYRKSRMKRKKNRKNKNKDSNCK